MSAECIQCGVPISSYAVYAGTRCRDCYYKNYVEKLPPGVHETNEACFQVQKITGPYPYRSHSFGAYRHGIEVRDPHHRKLLEKQHGITSDVDLKFATGGKFSTRKQMREYVIENQPRRKYAKEQS